MTQLTLNNKRVTVKAAPDTPLLWVIREDEIWLRHLPVRCLHGAPRR